MISNYNSLQLFKFYHGRISDIMELLVLNDKPPALSHSLSGVVLLQTLAQVCYYKFRFPLTGLRSKIKKTNNVASSMVRKQVSEKLSLKLPQITTESNRKKTARQTSKAGKINDTRDEQEIADEKIMKKKPNVAYNSKQLGTKQDKPSLLELSCKFDKTQSTKAFELRSEQLIFQRNQIRSKKKLPLKLFPLDYWRQRRSVISSSATQRGLQITSMNDTVTMKFRWSNYDKKDINIVLLDTV